MTDLKEELTLISKQRDVAVEKCEKLKATVGMLREMLEILCENDKNCGCESGGTPTSLDPEFICNYHKAITDTKADAERN